MKEIMVTRTVEATRAVVLCLNTVTAEPFNAECIIPYGTDDKEKALKYSQKHMDLGEESKAVSIVDMYIQETRYGMPLSQFIADAVKLEPLKKSE